MLCNLRLVGDVADGVKSCHGFYLQAVELMVFAVPVVIWGQDTATPEMSIISSSCPFFFCTLGLYIK